MKHSLLIATMAGLLWAGPGFATEPKLFCTAAEKEVQTCCCTVKDGKQAALLAR